MLSLAKVKNKEITIERKKKCDFSDDAKQTKMKRDS